MKYMLIVVAALLLTSCDRDAKLRTQITGGWVGVHTSEYQSELTFSPDGSYVSHWGTSNTSYTYRGAREIQDHSIVMTLTNTEVHGTTNVERVGSVDRIAIIIRADAVDLVVSNSSPPEIISLKRK